MTPLDYYNEQCQKGHIKSDEQQLRIIDKLHSVRTELLREYANRDSWKIWRRNQLVKGIYLWGGVGIGKTFLMDCFYHTLPFEQKLRMHFHAFLQKIHQDLTTHQGETDPLQKIAKDIATKTIVLCFDEFFVNDITDAMLLGRLLKALFNYGVCLVTTSNSAPDDLYPNGLQRLQFLPTIAMIKEQTEVIHLPSQMDYRLQHLHEAGVFYTPLNQAAVDNMEKTFLIFNKGKQTDQLPLHIHGRLIPVRKKSADIVWFEFSDICHIPRSQNDYLAIAQQYKTVFISDIPVISPENTDQISLFINLVDVFYDAKIKLVISAAQPVPELYSQGYKILEYQRTNSRLLEMQSTDYFIAGEE